jgi:solute carrier family 25 (mitochondrial citrate transporter), member 1
MLTLPFELKGIQFKGPVDCAMRTVRERGIGGLYKGLSAMVIGNSTKAATRFLSFEQFQRILSDDRGKTTGIRLVLGTINDA